MLQLSLSLSLSHSPRPSLNLSLSRLKSRKVALPLHYLAQMSAGNEASLLYTFLLALFIHLISVLGQVWVGLDNRWHLGI